MKHLWIISGCFCLLVGVAVGDWRPSSYDSWRQSGTLKYKTAYGGIWNYQKPDGSFAEIEEVWESVDDTLFIGERDVVTCRVRANGNSHIYVKMGEDTITIDRRLICFDWLDTTNYNHVTIHKPNFNNISVSVVDTRDVVFDFSMWDYRVRRGTGTVAHQIVLEPALLDSLHVLYGNLTAAMKRKVALANVYEIRLSVNDTVLLNKPRVRAKILKRFGRFIFGNRRQGLHCPGYADIVRPDTNDNGDTILVPWRVPVYQEWWKVGDKMYMGEYVSMRLVDSLHQAHPTWELWHAASEEFIDAGVEDTYINGSQACYNYGLSDYLYVVNGTGADIRNSLIRCIDVADCGIPEGHPIEACSLRMTISQVTTACSLHVYRGKKYWVEGDDDGVAVTDSGATSKGPNCYKSGRTCYAVSGFAEWTTVPCECGRDGGTDNNYDDGSCAVDSAADRTATPMYSCYVSATGDWVSPIDTALANAWYGGTAQENGVVIRTNTSSGEMRFLSSNRSCSPNEVCGRDVIFEFYYTGAAGPGQIITIEGEE